MYENIYSLLKKKTEKTQTPTQKRSKRNYKINKKREKQKKPKKKMVIENAVVVNSICGKSNNSN